MASTTARPSLTAVAERLPAFCRQHGIARVEVFGSLARVEATESSDVDLMITFRPEVHPGLEFFSMQDQLEALLGCKVDLVTRRAVERSENPIRQRSIPETDAEIYVCAQRQHRPEVIPLDLLPQRRPIRRDQTITGHGRHLHPAHDDSQERTWVRCGICRS